MYNLLWVNRINDQNFTMKLKEQSLSELPDNELVSLFFSLIRLRQQMENKYYANPTKVLACEVVELKKLIKWVEDVICSEPLG